MGLFKKIKDIFYDEEIVEVPVKEEPVRNEPVVTAPKIEPIKTSPIEKERVVGGSYSERELFKPEKTFDFPVFEDEEPVKTRSRTNILEIQKELEKRSNEINNRKEESKDLNTHSNTSAVEPKQTSTFKPSPVISPIYGILDKNYKKEDIVEKKEVYRPKKGDMNYDYVRRKAYGTLEDELENTLTKVNSEIVENVNEIEKELDKLPKPSKNIEDLLSEIEQNANVSIGEVEEAAKDKMMEEEEKQETGEIEFPDEKKEVNDNTLEHDLFNLIDSMYEDKEE